MLNSRITSRGERARAREEKREREREEGGERKELTTITSALSKEEGLTDEFTQVGGSIHNSECHV